MFQVELVTLRVREHMCFFTIFCKQILFKWTLKFVMAILNSCIEVIVL